MTIEKATKLPESIYDVTMVNVEYSWMILNVKILLIGISSIKISAISVASYFLLLSMGITTYVY